MAKKIFVCVESVNTCLRVAPVIKELLRNPDRYAVTVFSTLSNTGSNPDSLKALVRLFEKEDIQFVTSRGVKQFDQEIAQAREQYREQAKRAIVSLPREQWPGYRGVPLGPYIYEAVMADNSRKIADQVLFRHLLASYRPDLLLTGYDFGGVKRQMVIAAHFLCIPSLSLQYAGWRELRGQRPSDFFALWGPVYRQMHLDAGYGPERLFVTGSPHMDKFAYYGPEDRARVLADQGLDQGRKTVFFGPTAMDMSAELEALLQNIATRPDLQVLVKLHPECGPEHKALYQETLARHPEARATLLAQYPGDPAELLAACEVLIAPASNLIQEGLALGMDIILYCHPDTVHVDKNEKVEPVQHHSDEYSYLAHDPREMLLHLDRALAAPKALVNAPRAQRRKQELWHRLDGEASRRTLAAVDAILAQS